MSEFLESPAQLLAAYRLNGRTNYLSPEEITAAVQVVKQRRSASELKFVSVKHSEASKKEMLSAAAKGLPAPRSVRVLTFNAALNQTYVDFVLLSGKARGNSDTVTDLQALDGSRLSSSITMQDVQAALTPEDYAIIEKICQEYEPLLDALRRRGLDPKYLVADAWCVGYTGKECQSTERLAWPSLHYFDPSVDHTPYARPIEGINIRISLSKGKIIKFEDTGLGSVPVPGSFDTDSHYAPQDKMRTDLKPIVITQPFGPSFTIKKESNEILWLGWRMTIGFGGREGVTLHGICNQERPVIHRLSFSEMVVPYGDPRPPHCLKNAFDAGEEGLGRNANSLELGCDCVGLIHYLDGHMVTSDGGADTIKNAICIHEEDAGTGWKHTGLQILRSTNNPPRIVHHWRSGVAHVSRSRRLVISFFCTKANYDYGFYYYFYLDGTIEMEAKLTGILSTGALIHEEQQIDPSSSRTTPIGRKYGVRLGGSLYAPIHQHFFVCRIEFAVDGTKNSISEFNVERETEGSHNPFGNGFYYVENLLKTEQEAKRDCSSATGRFWRVFNPSVINKTGECTAYKLMPGAPVKPFSKLRRGAHEDTDKEAALMRAQFLEHQLWVTPALCNISYNSSGIPAEQTNEPSADTAMNSVDDRRADACQVSEMWELYPGGDFPNQLSVVDGLPLWTRKNRNVENTELVVWHVFGVTHLPRLEEWPIMPVEHCGFKLKPMGFFDSSPVMDVPNDRTINSMYSKGSGNCGCK